jgi:hypothetical protein
MSLTISTSRPVPASAARLFTYLLLFTVMALIDDNAGYHPRHTRWQWCGGAGEDSQGRSVVPPIANLLALFLETFPAVFTCATDSASWNGTRQPGRSQ